MPIVRLAHVLLLCLFIVARTWAAEPDGFVGNPGCRIAAPAPAPAPAGKVFWSGGCKDGYADGKGVLEWDVDGEGERRLEAVLVRGEVGGEGTLRYRGGSYTGSFRRAMPHGSGYFKYAGGAMYEGGVANGQREGGGLEIALDGSTYEGQWQADQRHGFGKASFTLGGSYEGEWRQGKMHGQGRIVYGSGRSHAGEFRDGHALGAAPAPVPAGEPGRYALKANQPLTRSNMLHNVAISAVPMEAPWEALTPGQKAILRNLYPALDDGDEPPYPLKGPRPLLKAVSDLYHAFTDYRGDALVYVTVGADGAPVTVSTYGVAHREFGRHLSTIAMMQRYKPALCAGKPCQMIYPINFRFDRN